MAKNINNYFNGESGVKGQSEISLDQNITSENGMQSAELCCRVCLQLEDLMVHIYDGGIVEDLQSDLLTLLERCGGLKIETYDNLPKYLCKECTIELLVAAKFREKCERSQQLLAGTNLKHITETMPIDLNKLKTNDHKSPTNGIINGVQLLDIQAADLIEVDLDETLDEGVILISTKEDVEMLTENTGTGNFEQEEKAYSSSSTFEQITAKSVAMQQKPRNGFKCNLCGAVFMQSSNLQRHIDKVHLLMQPYNCKHCGNTFSLEETFRQHMFTCSGPEISTTSSQRECTYCGKHLQSPFALNMHLRTHTGERPFSCAYCSKAFKTQSAYSMHLKRHAKKPDLICSICQKTFYEKSNLTTHMRTHTGEKPHSCSFCQKSFSRVFLLQLHMRTHTGEKPYQCKTCNRNFSQVCDLRYHERTHTGERKFKCTYCEKAFIKRCLLTAHLQRHVVLESEKGSIAANNANSEVVQSTTVHDESLKYTILENNILEGDSYFLSKAAEDDFCGLPYEEVTSLTETNQDIEWSNYVVEEV
ncbi:uncharacterized protein [Eurosta solidaginis]|uniref:uncharacterized protein isoform X2 n=1 Tax=Eurosta solidaginis TaxID=178769 RepID=UPI0035315385